MIHAQRESYVIIRTIIIRTTAEDFKPKKVSTLVVETHKDLINNRKTPTRTDVFSSENTILHNGRMRYEKGLYNSLVIHQLNEFNITSGSVKITNITVMSKISFLEDIVFFSFVFVNSETLNCIF